MFICRYFKNTFTGGLNIKHESVVTTFIFLVLYRFEFCTRTIFHKDNFSQCLFFVAVVLMAL